MSLTVQLSYEEKIINALSRVMHKRTDDCITRDKKDFDAIREMLKPLYAERDALKARVEQLEGACSYALKECSEAFNGGDFRETCDRVVLRMDAVLNSRDGGKP